MKKNSRFAGFYMGLIFFLMYLPIAVVIVFSFNESKLPVKFTGFSLKWYQELFHDRAMLEALVNSLILGVLSCLVSAVIGTLGAVGLSRIHWKSKGALEYISILPLMIPEIILGMVLMAFFYMLNLPFGMLTLLIGHTVFCVPYILMEVKARLAGMDPALEEAARDLGAGPFRAFRDITLPLIMPAVISGSLLAFAMSMDDVVISIFVNGPKLSTLPIKVYTQLKTGVTPEIIRLFLAKMPARHFHMSGKKVMGSEMQWRNPKVSMGLPGISEFEIYRTDSNVIREARHILEMAWRGNM